MEDTTSKIVGQIYNALANLGANPELLAIVGSWGETLDDEDVLSMLESYNESGTCVDKILWSVYDTPMDRRLRLSLVQGKEAAQCPKQK